MNNKKYHTAFRKIISRLIRKIFKKTTVTASNIDFKPYLKKKNVEGVSFDFWICDADGRSWYDLQCTDPVWHEMRFIRDYLIGEGDVVLECGGHHGCTAIILSDWVGTTGKVVTFEPSPKNCDIIEKNLVQNGITNVTLERKAVGDKPGHITINNETSNSSVLLSGSGVEVESVCLDEYACLRPTLLKIDVEGFELQVLHGAEKILSTRPKIAIEIHTDQLAKYGANVDSILESIGIKNYKTWIQRDDAKYPEEYDGNQPILDRCHLFCIPLRNHSS